MTAIMARLPCSIPACSGPTVATAPSSTAPAAWTRCKRQARLMTLVCTAVMNSARGTSTPDPSAVRSTASASW